MLIHRDYLWIFVNPCWVLVCSMDVQTAPELYFSDNKAYQYQEGGERENRSWVAPPQTLLLCEIRPWLIYTHTHTSAVERSRQRDRFNAWKYTNGRGQKPVTAFYLYIVVSVLNELELDDCVFFCFVLNSVRRAQRVVMLGRRKRSQKRTRAKHGLKRDHRTLLKWCVLDSKI